MLIIILNQLTTDQSRKRGTSIASSNSSTKSASPFLSAPLTLGQCTVCSEPDLPPMNRLAKCSDCGDLYHQSCHSPPLTKAVLEEAAEQWKCRKCKNTQDTATQFQNSAESGFPLGTRKPSGLSVTLKRYDADRTLEESVKMNKSSLTALLQRHAEWKSPTLKKSQCPPGVIDDLDIRRRSTSSVILKADKVDAAEESPMRRNSVDVSAVVNLGSQQGPPVAIVKDIVMVEERETVTTEIHPPLTVENSAVLLSETISSEELPPTVRAPLPPGTDEGELSQREISHHVSSGEAVPSIKPPNLMIPASQPSDSSQLSPSTPTKMAVLEPESPPVIRPHHRVDSKRDLVISDSEEETSPKRAKKTGIAATRKAAMKSATRIIPPSNGPVKTAMSSRLGGQVSSSATVRNAPSSARATAPSSSARADAKRTSEGGRRASVVAKKSGSKARLETPISEQSDTTSKSKETLVNVAVAPEKERELNTPVSPMAHGIRLFPRPSSPLPAIRPTDPGESQRYSLKLILTTGSNKNEPLVLDNEPAGFDFSTPYPIPLSQTIAQTPIALSPKPKRIKDEKNDFDILSLVPRDAVPILEEGKLAFREGTIDLRTGNLKRGARKFKVGRILPGELL
jgi:hypothetical protein